MFVKIILFVFVYVVGETGGVHTIKGNYNSLEDTFVKGLQKYTPPIYYMDKYCVEPLVLETRDAIRMSLWSTMYPPSTFTCTVRVQNRKYAGYHFCLTFKAANMTSKRNGSCSESRLDLFSGRTKRISEIIGICGSKAVREQYSTMSNMLTMIYTTNKLPLHSQETFEAVITPFHTGGCLKDEFKCSNSRCIKNNTVCDGYNNCGDDSDEKSCSPGNFSLSLAAIIGIAAGGAAIIVIGITAICCCWCCKYCKYEKL